MDILAAVKDANLFRSFLGTELASWRPWLTALRVLYGLPVAAKSHDLVRTCTGRDPSRLSSDGYQTALFLTGRRSGKSRLSATCSAFEAVLAGHEAKLAKGERGVVAIVAPTKRQGKIVRDYLRAIFEAPMLAAEVVAETQAGFELANRTRIEILAGDWRTVRGFTLLAAVIDEAAFFGYEAESKIRSDTELIRAIKPSLATTGGKLIAISSPYARKGWCYQQYRKNFGNDDGRTLVWNAPSRTMNPTLPQSVVDEAIEEDLQAAKSEYLGEFRDDIAAFISRELVESLVVRGRVELSANAKLRYFAFADLSGGRSDDAALAIAHRDGRNVVIDCLKRYKPPFSPHRVLREMATVLDRYGINRVTGDNYAADFVARGFQQLGVRYSKSEKPKAQLYAELLPILSSGEVELLDDERLISQLASLERRTRSGGRDVIDHPSGGHDDLANVVAGAVEQTSGKKRVAGVLF